MLSLLNKGWGVSHFVCHLVVMSTSALFLRQYLANLKEIFVQLARKSVAIVYLNRAGQQFICVPTCIFGMVAHCTF